METKSSNKTDMTMRPPSPKKRCSYCSSNTQDPNMDNPTSSRSDSGLPAVLMLLIGAYFSYLRLGGRLGSYQLFNTCVLDSLLAALHICYIKYPNIRSLLQSNTLFREIMCYLNCEDYNDAKRDWLMNLKPLPKHDQIDISGTIKDHLPAFAGLVCAQVDYHQETPTDSPIYESTLSKFRAFGNLKALGDESNPALILVDCDVDGHCKHLDFCVKDDLNRIFELDFLMLGMGKHMVMCFSLSKNMWILFDDDPEKPAFQLFKYEEDLCNYTIYLAGYVNKTEPEEYKHSIPETGAGATPFNLGSTQVQEISSKDPVEDLIKEFSNLQSCVDEVCEET